MRIFPCALCGHALHFENVRCLVCNSKLAFVPDLLAIEAIQPETNGLWSVIDIRGGEPSANRYRLCKNGTVHGVCNFAVPAQDRNPYCVACRLTRVLPDLNIAGNRERWHAVEVAKRRLFYTLAHLGLISPAPPPAHRERLRFEFLEDHSERPVLTGHTNGLITINIAEADDEVRARRRTHLHEPYRTLLGHFRHESGHYYWDCLIRDAGRLDSYRQVFGDESVDYRQSLKRHYDTAGRATDWEARHVSAYAKCHPWEDWAETWAHYLHMVDLLDTAASHDAFFAASADCPAPPNSRASPPGRPPDGMEFRLLVARWVPLTLLVNSLNRSLGQADAYPFALSRGALDKLQYIHEIVSQVGSNRRE
ncbi:putative zinc-binding metallopeptidase [Variovorax sp. OV329]|uniref:zinc-binding metallopeptidase family protein n=1 Tax=Variovorax sp. OV329 TaxID=1882825 RepID=UPI0008EF3BCD|nr:putative zinc-binding metallopeptidase [Variovorax sp. OV329]SFN48176.1 hypothetical protein SAMN05444747_12927 [Variovorax sp. OV329]